MNPVIESIMFVFCIVLATALTVTVIGVVAWLIGVIAPVEAWVFVWFIWSVFLSLLYISFTYFMIQRERKSRNN